MGHVRSNVRPRSHRSVSSRSLELPSQAGQRWTGTGLVVFDVTLTTYLPVAILGGAATWG
jgi:hypothetical protein